jgi:predicted nucleic acid-binding protein
MSSRLIATRHSQGLVISPVSYIELAPAFGGTIAVQNHFLAKLGVDWTERWTWRDTENAFVAWSGHVKSRRSRELSRRPIADILIGAFALRFRGLLTRNVRDFQRIFPNLRIESPK